jgi:hypothetical protein
MARGILALVLVGVLAFGAQAAQGALFLTRAVAHEESEHRVRRLSRQSAYPGYWELEHASECERRNSSTIECGFRLVSGRYENILCTGSVRVWTSGHYAYSRVEWDNPRKPCRTVE